MVANTNAAFPVQPGHWLYDCALDSRMREIPSKGPPKAVWPSKYGPLLREMAITRSLVIEWVVIVESIAGCELVYFVGSHPHLDDHAAASDVELLHVQLGSTCE